MIGISDPICVSLATVFIPGRPVLQVSDTGRPFTTPHPVISPD
ncbi:MAG: hypothetical protein V3V31_16640 [Methylococcales bacterium]